MHLTTSPVDWYAARAAGVAAYVLLTIVVVPRDDDGRPEGAARWPRFALEDVHRFGGLLVGSFVAIHVVTIAIDAYLPFSLTAIAIPFVARYRPSSRRSGSSRPSSCSRSRSRTATATGCPTCSGGGPTT